MTDRLRITGPLTEPHPVEECYGSRLHCFSHDADEAPEGYRFCFECMHMFVTPAELLAEHNRVLAGLGIDRCDTDPDRVYCCPFCTHDW